jgi:outer membrane murein-binding lipoprotein Lpp
MAAAVDRMDQPLRTKRQVLDHQILTSFLEGSSWEEAFEMFFLKHAELFAGFSVGSEYSLQQTEVHMKFLSSAEALLDGQLAEMAVTPHSFLAQLMADAATSEPAAAAMRYLEACIDFEQFGTMMRQRSERISSQIQELEQSNERLQNDVEAAKAAHAKLQQQEAEEEAELIREQQAIRDARERRRRAREDAMHRVAAAASSSDSLEPEPDLQPGSVADDLPGSWQSHPARIVGPILPQNGWEIGNVEHGVVSYWDARRGWGKIQRTVAPATDQYSNDDPTPSSATRIGKDEIFVHNLQLPMDAPKRWLRRGEMVQFTVGLTVVPRGPQACGVVGLSAGADGDAGMRVSLLCQTQLPRTSR